MPNWWPDELSRPQQQVRYRSGERTSGIAKWYVHNRSGVFTLQVELTDGTEFTFDRNTAVALHEASDILVREVERYESQLEDYARAKNDWLNGINWLNGALND